MQRYSLSVDQTNVLLNMVMYTLQYKVKNDLCSKFFFRRLQKRNNATHLNCNTHDKVRRPVSYSDQ